MESLASEAKARANFSKVDFQLHVPLLNARSVIFELSCDINRVRTGHGKPEKSWNLSISVSRPGKSWNMIVGHGKSWEIVICVVRKLLQVPKQGKIKKLANYVRKYSKTRMILTIFEVAAKL